MNDGQGGDAPETTDDLAKFLLDNPDADQDPDNEDDAEASDEPEQDNSDEPDEDSPAEDDDESSEDAEKQKSGLKFKVPVKGEDGAETSIEVDEKELIAGYQRHADYTRKTQQLAEKEREAFQVVTTEIEKGRNYYVQQAQQARAAVHQLAGLRSPQEMAVLAQTDPTLWVQENQRAQMVHGVLAQIEQGVQYESQQLAQQAKQEQDRQVSRAWGVLGSQGIDKDKLGKILETMHEKYKAPWERLNVVTDPTLIMIMRDAAAYQGLKDKKGEVTAKAKEAPRLPAQRQSVPKNEQANKRLNAKFSSGKAKLNDLAAWIAAND
jgi:uncharacterized protein YifE (UPF0438 family)